MNNYKFNLEGFDECLNGATKEEKGNIQGRIKHTSISADNEIDAYEKLCKAMNGQELNINEDKAYFELCDYAQGIYISII